MIYSLKMKVESLFFVVNCWLLLTMNCGLVQNRDSIFIISEWVNMFICAVRSTTLILLSDNAIYSLCKDREGGIWIGSYFGGVNYYPRFYTYFEKYYPKGD